MMEQVYNLFMEAKRVGVKGNLEEYAIANTKLQTVLDNLSDDDIIKNSKWRHPLLHESAHQLANNILLVMPTFRIIWDHPRLLLAWDTPHYCDEYGLTASQRLSIRLGNYNWDVQHPVIQEIRYKYGVIPTCNSRGYDYPPNPKDYRFRPDQEFMV